MNCCTVYLFHINPLYYRTTAEIMLVVINLVVKFDHKVSLKLCLVLLELM